MLCLSVYSHSPAFILRFGLNVSFHWIICCKNIYILRYVRTFLLLDSVKLIKLRNNYVPSN